MIGEGEVAIVSVPPMAQNIEMAWEWPAIRRMFEGFAAFCRFVPFDKRGTGVCAAHGIDVLGPPPPPVAY